MTAQDKVLVFRSTLSALKERSTRLTDCIEAAIHLRYTTNVSALQNWTPEQIANGKTAVEAWRRADIELEQIRREELQNLDTQKAIRLLCGPADYTIPPRAPKPTSGLIEQQRWFKKAAGRE